MRLPGLVVLTLACAGCGGAAPTEPSSPIGQSSSFLTGQYYLQLMGSDFSSDPQIPACPGFIGVPRAGKSVTVVLTVTRQGAEWVGTPSAGSADLELRFRDAGIVGLGHRAFSGTLRGRATDQAVPSIPLPSNGVTVSVSGSGAGSSAIIEGQTLGAGYAGTLGGRAVGEFRFEDQAGVLATCGTVSVQMVVLNSGN